MSNRQTSQGAKEKLFLRVGIDFNIPLSVLFGTPSLRYLISPTRRARITVFAEITLTHKNIPLNGRPITKGKREKKVEQRCNKRCTTVYDLRILFVHLQGKRQTRESCKLVLKTSELISSRVPSMKRTFADEQTQTFDAD